MILKTISKLLIAGGILLLLSASPQAERVKDIASIAGVRDNQLLGYGLVVGLDGTGDKSGQTFTEQSFRNMLVQMGINLPVGVKLDSKNIAAVMITAALPPFAKPGQKIDVTVSSIGSAKSLRGGTLLMTPLKGADNQVYAVAQGNLTVGGFGVSGKDGSKITVNVPSVGRIPGGASVERSVASPFAFSEHLIFNLHQADFTTSKRLAKAINTVLGPDTAHSLDAMSVKVTAPVKRSQRASFVSLLENIELQPGEASAKIIVNSRTGTIVIGQHVRVSPAAVAHGSLVVTISENPVVSQPNALSEGETVALDNSKIDVEQKKSRAFVFEPGASLKDIVRSVNAVGAAPGDLVAILEALKEVGALRAELIVI